MPLVKVEIFKGKSEGYKKAILDGIHSALVQTIQIPEQDRYQRLYEMDPSNVEIAQARNQSYTFIEITLFKGRSLEAKKRLYQAIVENLARKPGIDKEDVMIVLHEPPLENFGIQGGKAASEVELTHRIDV